MRFFLNTYSQTILGEVQDIFSMGGRFQQSADFSSLLVDRKDSEEPRLEHRKTEQDPEKNPQYALIFPRLSGDLISDEG